MKCLTFAYYLIFSTGTQHSHHHLTYKSKETDKLMFSKDLNPESESEAPGFFLSHTAIC